MPVIDQSLTHRCIECPLRVEHTPDEMCPSCGRCAEHCDELGHAHMKPRAPDA